MTTTTFQLTVQAQSSDVPAWVNSIGSQWGQIAAASTQIIDRDGCWVERSLVPQYTNGVLSGTVQREVLARWPYEWYVENPIIAVSSMTYEGSGVFVFTTASEHSLVTDLSGYVRFAGMTGDWAAMNWSITPNTPRFFKVISKVSSTEYRISSSLDGSGWFPFSPGTATSEKVVFYQESFKGHQPARVTALWTGACYDNDRNEMIYLANGGHGENPGNEGYALALWHDTPYWYRFVDPTPNELMLATFEKSISTPYHLPTADPGVSGVNEWANNETTGNRWPATSYMDGRPRTMHTAGHECYFDGNIWIGVESSTYLHSGGPGNGVWRFDRDWIDPVTGAQCALATEANPLPPALPHYGFRHTGPTEDTNRLRANGPWKLTDVHASAPTSITNLTFGWSAVDRPNKKVWGIGGVGTPPTAWCIDAEPTSGTYGKILGYKQLAASTPFGVKAFWCVECEDAGPAGQTIFVLGGQVTGSTPINTEGVWVVIPHPTDPTQTQSYWRVPTVASGGTAFMPTYKMGGGFHNGVIYLLAPYMTAGTIYRLQVPADVTGSWSGCWLPVLAGSESGGPPTDHNVGTYNRAFVAKFGANDEIGVMVFNGGPTVNNGGAQNPTYVMRLP